MKEWQEFTEEVIEALLEDGSNQEAMHTIEHHFSCEQPDIIEAAVLVAFKQGYQVTDLEEFETDEGGLVVSFDVIIESPLEEACILEDIEKLLLFAEQNAITYDGWGTFFED